METRSRQYVWLAAALPLLVACQMRGPSNPVPPVTGTIRQVLPSAESVFYVTVVIAMQNHTLQPVSVNSYALEWPDGKHIGPAQPLELAASESRDWRVRVTPDSGDITTLLEHPEMARVIILDVRR